MKMITQAKAKWARIESNRLLAVSRATLIDDIDELGDLLQNLHACMLQRQDKDGISPDDCASLAEIIRQSLWRND